VVLFLFVRHPEPIAASLLAGIAVMLAHRVLARPYMDHVLPQKCIWCNRVLPPALDASTRTLDLETGRGVVPARCCAGHCAPAARFFTFLNAARLPISLGIFAPLVLLLAALAAAALGWARPLPAATALFQLAVGLAVNLAAVGYLFSRPVESRAPIRVPFPSHNFFLLGTRTLLWIFRIVGLWWIYRGLLGLWPPR
jgi:hypothetical protein